MDERRQIPVVLSLALSLALLAVPAWGEGFKQLDLLVTDYQNDRVLLIDPQSGVYSVFSPPVGAATNLLNKPIGITITQDGNVYVANSADDNLIKIDPLTGDQTVVLIYRPGFPIGTFEPVYIGHSPVALAADASGALYAAANASYDIVKLTGLGTSGLNSVTLTTDPALQLTSTLILNGSEVEVAARLSGVWTLPVSGV